MVHTHVEPAGVMSKACNMVEQHIHGSCGNNCMKRVEPSQVHGAGAQGGIARNSCDGRRRAIPTSSFANWPTPVTAYMHVPGARMHNSVQGSHREIAGREGVG